MSNKQVRLEHDSMGEVQVPSNALYGAQTQRALDNFGIAQRPLPQGFISTLAQIKAAAAQVNFDLGLLDKTRAESIVRAAQRVASGRHVEQFPVDVFQTGSGTSTNMNMNEVLAHIASELGDPVHPNDHVNMGQSSNDVIPTAIHISAYKQVVTHLLPSLEHLATTIDSRADELDGVVKTGRTHLMDALPIRLGDEFGAWLQQVRHAAMRIQGTLPRLGQIALGGTAVGSGVNAHPEFATRCAQLLSTQLGQPLTVADNSFAALASQDTAVELHGQLKTLAVTLYKISNDLRWMNSGPNAGLAEISLPALQPGSSIMPGKVNPVIPEAVCMAATHVMGNDTAMTVAGQSGSFQLNVMLPLIGDKLLDSIGVLGRACTALADKAIAGLQVNQNNLQQQLRTNPILVTALNPLLGYEKAAAIAHRAQAEQRPVLDVAKEECQLDQKELEQLLDPILLTRPHG